MLASITEHKEKFKPSDNSLLATHALPHSIQHQYLIDAVTQDFLTALHNVPLKGHSSTRSAQAHWPKENGAKAFDQSWWRKNAREGADR